MEPLIAPVFDFICPSSTPRIRTLVVTSSVPGKTLVHAQ